MTTTITTITKIIWIKPPPTCNENPRSHKISSITAIVQSMATTIHFDLSGEQAVYSGSAPRQSHRGLADNRSNLERTIFGLTAQVLLPQL
jgi:hypothetical protein